MSDTMTLSLPSETVAALAEAAAEIALARLREQNAGGCEWPEWMSVETAARYLDVPEERVRKLKERREIPYYQEAPGCRVFFRRSELDDWMSNFRRGPVAKHAAKADNPVSVQAPCSIRRVGGWGRRECWRC
jgi:excisionase family DNA binding protein